MITDPENPDEQPQQFDEPILAANLEEAQRICRLKADRDGVKLVSIQPPSRIRPGKNQRYICIFQSNPIEP
jgi:hypothetical protein